ncbi:MAG: type VII toxin-antitoxin system MntA family adenylyltransferase antitoxin [Promethearchaeota archaeon]
MIDLKLIKDIALKHQLKLIYLFSSKATGRDFKKSDIDIAILLNEHEPSELKDLILELIFDFSLVFSSDKIDLLVLDKAPLAIQYNVIAEGKVLYEVNTETRVSYETNLISIYLDFKKYEDEYYKAMHEQILEENPP